MTLLAFDGRMGAAGDMILGALLAAGANPDALIPVEDAIDVRYAIEETTKNGIRATSVDVLLDGEESAVAHDPSHSRHDSTHDHAHRESGHTHRHDSDRGDAHGHGAEHAEGAGTHRTYPEVVEIVEGMDLPEAVEADALSIFEHLGEAESAVHGTDLYNTHFHEVGTDDAVADVVGAALLLDDLSPGRVVTTPLSTGGGEVQMSHGHYPVPTPAVVEIAARADWSLRGGPVEAELLTPTGAAILAHVAAGVDSLPPIRLDASGYGAGDRDFPEHPNVLRAMVGDVRESEAIASHSEANAADAGGCGLDREEIRVLETNVDDVSPEVLGGLHETLSAVGARDVSVTPITMKKSRPGHLVRVIVRPEDAARVARRLAEETGTLGVRETGARHRWVAERKLESVVVEVEGERFEVDVKVASDVGGTVYDVSAEYDDAAALARETGLPVREVMRLAEAAFEA